MILLDYSQIALANIIVQKIDDEELIRHMILNSIRMYNKKYRDEYHFLTPEKIQSSLYLRNS